MKCLPKAKSICLLLLMKITLFPLQSILFFPWMPGTAWVGSWVLISTAQVSCQSIPNKTVSKMLMEGVYSFEELQFNPWKLTGLESQLRRSCSSNVDLGRHQLLQLVLSWGRKGGTCVGGGQVIGFLQWRVLYSETCFPQLFAAVQPF